MSPFRPTLRALLLAAVFGAGYLLGTANPPASAQMGGLGERGAEMLGEAREAAGAAEMPDVARMGEAIARMKDRIRGLQEDLGLLERIQATLGGAGATD